MRCCVGFYGIIVSLFLSGFISVVVVFCCCGFLLLEFGVGYLFVLVLNNLFIGECFMF